MKKGLTIALLMVAMVALAASASAIAPTIGELPPVIIGDAGDVSGAGTTALHLLKYDNVFNFAEPGIVDVRLTAAEASGKQFMSVFYTLPVTTMTLRASNATSLVQPMTDTEVTALLAGAAPAGKQINTASSTWLSLVQVAGTAPASAAAATVAANGSTEPELTAKGSLDPVPVTLYATNSEVPTDKVSAPKTFVVYSILGANDAFSGATTVYQSPADLGTANLGGWGFTNAKGTASGALQAGTQFSSANGIGFSGLASWAAGKNQGYANWDHPTVMAPAANMAGKIYRGTFTMSGDQTDALKTPGYRILFLNFSFSHVGGFQAVTTGGAGYTATNMNSPSAAGTTENRLYWTTPVNTVNFADGGLMATIAGATDLRDYYLTFDLMQTDAGDIGTVVLESATIEKIARPADATPSIAWGAIPRASGDIAGHAFNQAGFSWIATTNDSGTGWGVGVSNLTGATAATLGMKTTPSTTKSVFQQINPDPTAVGFPVYQANKLVRVTYNVSVSDASKTPTLRMFVLPWTTPITNFKLASTLWGESLDPTAPRGSFLYAKAATGANSELAASPKTGGSIIETYIYTMNAPTEAAVLTPTFDVGQGTGVTFPQNGWAVPNATVSVKGLAMEVLN